jgi:hypothetical protein
MSRTASLVACSIAAVTLGPGAEPAAAPSPGGADVAAWLAASLLEGPFELTARGTESVIGTTFANATKQMGIPTKPPAARGEVELKGAFTIAHHDRSDPAFVGELEYHGKIHGTATGTGTSFEAAKGLPPATPTMPCAGAFDGTLTLRVTFKDYNARRIAPKLVVDYSANVDCGGGVTLNVSGANLLDAGMHSAVVPAPSKPGAFRAPFPIYSHIMVSTESGGDMVLGEGTLKLGGLFYGETALDVPPMSKLGRSVDAHVFFLAGNDPKAVLPHANFAGEVWADGVNQVTIDPGPVRSGRPGHVSSPYGIVREVRSWTKDVIASSEAPRPPWWPDVNDPVQDWVDCPGVTMYAGRPATWGTRSQTVLDEFLVRVAGHPEFGTVYVAFAMELRKNAYRIWYSESRHVTEDEYKVMKASTHPSVAYPFGDAGGGWIVVPAAK